MKKFVLLAVSAAAAAGGSAVMAQEVGRVISATPLMVQVAVPRQVCSTEQVAVQGQKSGAGAVMGALAGGAAGNAVGQGGGKAVATMLGLVGGAILGDHIEGGGTSVQNVQRCTTQTFYENRANGYNVVYEYAGKQYTVQMPNNPGPTVQLQVTPVGASAPAPAATTYAAPAGTYVAPATTYVSPPVTTVVETQPVYVSAPVYYPGYYAPSYAPLGVGLALGLGIGYYSHGHWGGHHWRR